LRKRKREAADKAACGWQSLVTIIETPPATSLVSHPLIHGNLPCFQCHPVHLLAMLWWRWDEALVGGN